MTTESVREESINVQGETRPGARGYSHQPPVWMAAAPDEWHNRRLREFLQRPVSADTGLASPPKSYQDVLAELREATGLDVVLVQRFDPATREKTVVENARAIVKNALAELFPQGFVFDPIEVEIATYQDGDEYLNVRIVFEGASEQITPDMSGGLIRHIRPQLAELGFPGVPAWSFVEKSEWMEYFQRKRNAPARTD